MAKRLTDNQKNELIKSFMLGRSIDDLSQKYSCTKLTITRNLKKNLSDAKYSELIEKAKILKKNKKVNQNNLQDQVEYPIPDLQKSETLDKFESDSSKSMQFVEIAPIDYAIDNTPQKDLSSIPLSEIDFPKVVFMIVDNKIELYIKLLKDYPEWKYMSQEDLNRKTLQIYFDLKAAKRDCGRDQKVIKIPNPNVFKIVSRLLLSRGISRIVSSDKLIAL